MLSNDAEGKMSKDNWLSERILFGLLIIGGYIALSGMSILAPLNAEARQTARDVLLVLGPILGVIANAIWKSDKVDRQTANTAAVLAAKAPDFSSSAILTPVEGTKDESNQDAQVAPTPNPLARKPS